MDLIFKNGTIITAYETYKADIGVKDGKIVMIGENLNNEAAKVVDITGKYF